MAPPDLDLVLDVGNTRTKAALFGSGGLLRHAILPPRDGRAVDGFLAGAAPAAIVMASVAAPDEAFQNDLARQAPLLEVRGETPVPFNVAVDRRSTLGADRLANAAGLHALFPGRRALAIDAGTCITYDVMDEHGTFLGGVISPGMSMRARAMHTYSARLPLVEPGASVPSPGRDTVGALAAGIVHGIRLEMAGMIADLTHEHPDPVVVLTGGDGLRFARALKSGIFADPLLTLRGLHAILLHHRVGGGPFLAPGWG
ncbi:MAG: type III pantothenate kinase [Flavobacteriales bacterium]|nr:type III pantothenate kinase [Flavobacteriales bacterium]MCB0812029.1 type III pantothenate kinase [Flavobacteriales bacterium]MCB0816061.1 type III pantothenate kinase [Flavobacteriales bacterium]HOP42540.1 type III pantothenate kinase [Flavobacteriales bacterium]HPF66752.1 type III pantothenate kinase [Flavobacteriales bacterium]